MSGECSLRMRIVSADFYSAPPFAQFDETYNHFRGSVIKQLPVIRVFGITPGGDKVCAHIHGVLPYIYIPFPASVPQSKENALLYELAEGLDEALNNSFGSKKHHVSKVSKVSARSFYGYHSNEESFLKILFYYPYSIKRAVSLLQSGAVCQQAFQPHEAHVPYILQFFIDYNLYGMNFLNLSDWSLRTLTNPGDAPSPLIAKESTCAVEVDAVAGNILNLQSSSACLNPGLAYIRQEEEQRNAEDGICLDEPSLSSSDSIQQITPSPSDLAFRQRLSLALQERFAKEVNDEGEECSSQNISASQQPPPVAFDAEDMSVLKVLFGRLVGEEPEEDSILGFTPNDRDDQEEAAQAEDLSQPYVSFIAESDEDVPSKDVDLSETLLWPDLDGLSQLEGPLQVDGTADGDATPEKGGTKAKPCLSPRYAPLSISLRRSPRSSASRNKSEHPTSPELFRKLEENVSNLRSIKSPSSKVQKKLSDARPSTSSANTFDDEDIIGGSDNSENEESEKRIKYNLLENNSKLSGGKLKKKRKLSAAKKVLFGDTTYSHPASSSIKVGNAKISSTTREVEITTSGGITQICTPESSALPDNSEDSIHLEDPNCENIDFDTTSYSQCTIMSFYGDTTMCLSPFEYSRVLRPALEPPTREEICASLTQAGLEEVACEGPFYANPSDTPSTKEVGSDTISLKGRCGRDLEEFRGSYSFAGWPDRRRSKGLVVLQPAQDPPSSDFVRRELELASALVSQPTSTQSSGVSFSLPPKQNKLKRHKIIEVERAKRQSGEIEHATPNNSGMFKLDFQNLQDAQMNSLHKYTTLMAVEIHACTRGELRPDPEYDGVEAVFYVIASDAPPSGDSLLSPRLTGVIMVCPEEETRQYPFDCSLVPVSSEKDLFLALTKLVTLHNPDIIAGYEIEMLSWGYLIERGFILGLNLLTDLSRVKAESRGQDLKPSTFSNKDYDLRVPGRIVLNVWRLMRHEVALQSYTFESVAYHVLHTRIPKFSFKSLTHWWNHFSKCHRILVLKYYLTMVDGIEKLLDQLNLVGRTCELASLFGIQFYEVLSRGSQFRVESMMLRLAKRLGFIAVSPSVEQRAQMRAPESLPLIMEPESRFYSDPVIVLDFQSLYPSMIIAYNYCFSTCLGRVSSLMETSDFKFGCTELHVPLKELLKLQKNIHVSPAGVAFVDKSIRHGVLPQMLEEILQTRLMVKGSLKRHKQDKLLSRVLDARQLGLKLIANVTYGYTSANFSGRMPCIEVGDSVVSKGRETLERAIQLVEGMKEWRARVVYGDTDSLFVLCRGRSRADAFQIGQQIADMVTAANPAPVKLKLEKVYQPCILQTKKRYVGFMYESPEQEKPEFDAKGIETVRRDGCPAASKVLEKSLKLLFQSLDMSTVKAYVMQQMTKVLSGRLSPAELAFAKEYRGVSGYQPNAPVPALKIAKEMVKRDRRSEPRTSERVSYVVVCGPPGLPLIALVRSLSAFLVEPAYSLNADYYISKAILPPLQRCFCLLGADVFSWYSELPRKMRLQCGPAPREKKATIAQYFRTAQCLACGSLSQFTLCQSCSLSVPHTLSLLSISVGRLEGKSHLLTKMCGSCCGRNYETDCVSLDCPVFYRRHQASRDKMQTDLLYATIAELSQF